jgi:hypothetical protein
MWDNPMNLAEQKLGFRCLSTVVANRAKCLGRVLLLVLGVFLAAGNTQGAQQKQTCFEN